MANITVKVVEFNQQAKASSCISGTTLAGFLERRKMKYNSSVRVNANVVSKDHVLKSGDIVSHIGRVSGA